MDYTNYFYIIKLNVLFVNLDQSVLKASNKQYDLKLDYNPNFTTNMQERGVGSVLGKMKIKVKTVGWFRIKISGRC